jgi:hypothetical protein
MRPVDFRPVSIPMYPLVFLAPLVSAWVALRFTPMRALLAVYLPLLLLVPESFRATLQGIPKMNFNQAAIVPVVLVALLRYGRNWRPSVTDVAVFALAVLIALSEFLAAGYKEAQNLMFAMLASMAGPYLAARLLLDGRDRDVAFARRFVILMFAVVIVGAYEFRFGVNPFLRYLGNLFPGQGLGWVTTFRHGFARVAGPYSHAILAGIMVVMAYRLQRWLQWGRHWEPRFSLLPALPWSKAAVISLVLAVGAAMTIARGPILGALLGATVIMIGSSRRRRQLLPAAILAFVVLAPLGYLALMAYLDIEPGAAMTMSQESALYRKVMIERYIDIAIEHTALGWGRNTWPKLPGMASIDNYFLLLSLMHGLLATGLLLFLFLWQGVRLFRRGMAEPHDSNSLALTFAGILLAVFVTLGTVYLGEQVMPMLFVILGWSEAYLQRAPLRRAAPARAATVGAPMPRLRVIR